MIDLLSKDLLSIIIGTYFFMKPLHIKYSIVLYSRVFCLGGKNPLRYGGGENPPPKKKEGQPNLAMFSNTHSLRFFLNLLSFGSSLSSLGNLFQSKDPLNTKELL